MFWDVTGANAARIAAERQAGEVRAAPALIRRARPRLRARTANSAARLSQNDSSLTNLMKRSVSVRVTVWTRDGGSSSHSARRHPNRHARAVRLTCDQRLK